MAFFHYISRPADTTPSVFDMGHLQRLKQQTGSDVSGVAGEGDKKIARQFEALYIQQLLKQARQASQLDGPFDSDQTRLVQSMADEQLALQLADPGLGLARTLLEQIRGDYSLSGASADRRQGKPVEPADLATLRLPGLQSSVGPGHRQERADGQGFADRLASSSFGRGVATVVSAIRGAPRHIETFVSKMTHAARQVSTESGIPAELILSQAALESGWGQREIRGSDGQNSYNLFGIKASAGWTGKVVDIMTTEYENGSVQKRVESFRAYNSYAESFRDYARLISQNERYSEVLAAPSAPEAARQIQKAGYATDPAYAEKLIAIMGYFRAGPG